MRAQWVAIKLVVVGKELKNKWYCKACDKCCTAVLPLSEAPDNNCNGGYET